MAFTLDRETMNKIPNRPARAKPSKLPLFAIVGLIVTTIALVVFGQRNNMGVVKAPMAIPLDTRDIVFVIDEANVIQINDLQTGAKIASYTDAEGEFVLVAKRALDRMAPASKAAETTPYRLEMWRSGIVSLTDTLSGQRLNLNAFGKDNTAVFSQLLNTNNTTDKPTANAAKTN
ncbi:MAG: photosynthetic complex assembly protein PuhC [Ahrensia sp.]|nr:photosynthetic complex assembly protein PuhC [Ahrensia sp.]